MHDARIRLVSLVSLSIATFLSIAGATLTMAWLFLSPLTLKETVKSAAFLGVLVFVGIVAVVTQLSGNDGASYFIRTGVILLLAF